MVFFYFSFSYQNFPKRLILIDVIYHGSPNSNLEIITPKNNHIRDEQEGPVVFATFSMKIASCYLFKWDDSWVHQSIYWEDNNKIDYQVIMVISDKVRFIKEDKGGAIYILPAQKFEFDENKGMGIFEWTYKGAIRPFLQINFFSALDAMQKLGVQVYSVDSNQFQYYLSLLGKEKQKFLSQLKNRNSGNKKNFIGLFT